ncbi:hypothetical protein AYO44_01330 [Planctomycetaceae bacterium SCGC AG-212-F19]|nr:hypothetical protein AYO44_01330 [Planctomycetaceae bacterium SCGC AG-212-F19]
MKRLAAVLVLAAGLCGCTTTGTETAAPVVRNGVGYRPSVPGFEGPMGQPVPITAPYAAKQPSGAEYARAMMAANMQPGMAPPGGGPSGIMQAGAFEPAGGPSGIMQTGGIAPPGMPPPPGMMTPPGVPNGIMPVGHQGPVPNAVAAVGAINGPGGPRFPTRRTEVRFVGPAGMKIAWPGAMGDVRNNQIEAPGRYNFVQGAIYRLKLSDLPGRPGVDLYPTLEVVPANLRTDAYIAHSAVPVYFTEEDFEQVLGGNFLVKVIYLPNPQYADVAMTGGPEEVVSTRLEPGADPIAEACKRGSILLIIRVGNIDLEAPHTPPMNAPPPGGGGCGMMGAGPMPGGMPMMAGMPMGMPGPGMPMGMPGPGMPMGMPAPGMPGGMVMQPPGLPQIPGAPVMPVGGPTLGKDQSAPLGIPMVPPAAGQPGVKPAGGQPVSRLPDPTTVKPVRYEEPMNAPTPAQVAGQGR